MTLCCSLALTLAALGCDANEASRRQPRSITPTRAGVNPAVSRAVVASKLTAKQAPPTIKAPTPQPPPETNAIPAKGTKLELSDEQWRERLSPIQFYVLREQGTEPPWTGAYLDNKEQGVYHCAACNNPLFSSTHKFKSGTGWPSYWDVVEPGRVAVHEDHSHGMVRRALACAHCGGHLGHVFDDGPQPTGLRYCIDSISLFFRPGDASAPEPNE